MNHSSSKIEGSMDIDTQSARAKAWCSERRDSTEVTGHGQLNARRRPLVLTGTFPQTEIQHHFLGIVVNILAVWQADFEHTYTACIHAKWKCLE